MKTKTLSVVAILLLISSTSFSQELKTNGKISSIRKGEISKFDGVVLDDLAFAEILSQNEFLEKRLKTEFEYELSKKEIEYSFNMERLKLENEISAKRNEEIDDLRKEELLRLEKQLVNLKPIDNELAMLIGFSSGIIFTIAMYFVASYTSGNK